MKKLTDQETHTKLINLLEAIVETQRRSRVLHDNAEWSRADERQMIQVRALLRDAASIVYRLGRS